MDKRELAAIFFENLGENSNQFITEMIEKEMDAELIDIFNTFGGQLNMGNMDPDRFQTSLLIIGYLVRAHEDAAMSTNGDPVH